MDWTGKLAGAKLKTRSAMSVNAGDLDHRQEQGFKKERSQTKTWPSPQFQPFFFFFFFIHHRMSALFPPPPRVIDRFFPVDHHEQEQVEEEKFRFVPVDTEHVNDNNHWSLRPFRTSFQDGAWHIQFNATWYAYLSLQ